MTGRLLGPDDMRLQGGFPPGIPLPRPNPNTARWLVMTNADSDEEPAPLVLVTQTPDDEVGVRHALAAQWPRHPVVRLADDSSGSATVIWPYHYLLGKLVAAGKDVSDLPNAFGLTDGEGAP
jgi:hypothetical protein